MALETEELPGKISRNHPCPCGSGRKYKKCCLIQPQPALREEVDRLFTQAGLAQVQGDLKRAGELYAAVVSGDPCHAGARHRLGAMAIAANRLEEGGKLIGEAIALDPSVALYHCDLGVAFHHSGRFEEAAAAYHRAIDLQPDFADALANLGGVLFSLERPEEALPHLEKVLAGKPSHAIAHTNLGLVLHALGRSREGMYHARKGAELAPHSLLAVRSCAAMLVGLGRTREALPYCRQWAALTPEDPLALQAVANGCRGTDPQEAGRLYWKVLQLDPGSYAAANNLGLCLAQAGYDAAAVPLYRRVTELRPDWAMAWSNLGEALRNLGEGEAALESHERALALDPTNGKVRWNRALCLLSLGRLAEGWAEYGARCASQGSRTRPFTQPHWDGSHPAGKTVLVWMEQGLGDEILFSGMIPDLVRAGAHCVVECDPRLVTLLQRSFPAVEVVGRNKPVDPRTRQPDIDYQIAAGSLARWFRPTLESFPRHSGYFVPDPARVEFWKQRLAALGEGLKVGICWRSMVHQGSRAKHYSQLKQWGPILTTPGVRFVNLQYDRCEEELREAESLFGVPIHAWAGTDLKDDQETLAALSSQLDLVISAPTAVHAIAGAVGTPNWVPIRGLTMWWGMGTGRCPWLPSTRAFPLGATDPWEPAFQEISAELAALCKRSN